MTTKTDTLCDCGHVAKSDGMTPGYGIAPDGTKHCFACCAERDKAQMREKGRATLYWAKSADGWHVSNWPGTLKIKPRRVSHGRHNMARMRTDVWFTFEGQHWHGVTYGEWTQILHCRRLKNQ